jgi:predicted HAD superfamily Cof-like phosphohydrolase
MPNDYEAKVREFMDKHELYSQIIPGHPPMAERLSRIRYILEEVGELVQAIHEEDLVEIADALGDLLYVVFGCAIAYGIPIDTIFNEVHRSNMTKVKLGPTGKGGKTSGFEPPNLYSYLEETKEEL